MTLDDQDLPDEDNGYALLMPFVVCQSQGGPFDDVSFTIGFELGQIDRELAMCQTLSSEPIARYIHEDGLPQLDLIAMRRGFTIKVGHLDGSDEWRYVEFIRESDADGE